ncbi:MAG: hypothetical protein QGG89_12135 [Vicinamibacterales bacterium]|jgi:hypothetical protein|nr:hypothetical protein [Vicinamibacterales bacterium]
MSSYKDLWDKQAPARVHKDGDAEKPAKAPAAKKKTPAAKKAKTAS